MKSSEIITWAFQHPELSLSAGGGLAILLLGLSVWGIRRTLVGRNEAILPMARNPILNDVADAARAAAARADPSGDENGDESSPAAEQSAEEIGEEIGEDAWQEIGETENATLDPVRIQNEMPIQETPTLSETDPEPEQEPVKSANSGLRPIAQAVFDRNFPRLDIAAYEEAAANFAVFVDRLTVAAEARLSPEELARMAHADMQLLLCSLLSEVSKREDGEKYGVLIALLIGRIKHHDNPNITELLDHAIEEVGRINVDQLRVVIMCLYLRGFQLKSGGIEALEKVVKYALDFGMGANFANMRTGLLFTRGLLMHNGALERVEIQILRKYAAAFQDDPDMPKNMDRATAVKLVHKKLNLSPDQCAVLEAWGQTQSGHATATGIGWAAAAAFIEHRTKQPADWERVIS